MSGRSRQGFASIDRETHRAISSRGGQARRDNIGVEGYIEMGRKGGAARAEQRRLQREAAEAAKNIQSPKK